MPNFKIPRKENAIMQAKLWNELTERTLSEYTDKSVKETEIYTDNMTKNILIYNRYTNSDIIFRISDTTATIHEFLKLKDTDSSYENKKITALNFASFTHPGASLS